MADARVIHEKIEKSFCFFCFVFHLRFVVQYCWIPVDDGDGGIDRCTEKRTEPCSVDHLRKRKIDVSEVINRNDVVYVDNVQLIGFSVCALPVLLASSFLAPTNVALRRNNLQMHENEWEMPQ